MENYLNNLNEQQRAAVEYIDGPSLVIAGAGSGKTRVLTYKIIHLLSLGYNAHRILALTFTNKAANEMKERISLLIKNYDVSNLWIGTFHSIFLRILRFHCDRIGFKSGFTIYDTADSKALIKTIIKELQLDEKIYKSSSIQSQISNIKNALISPMKYEIDAKALFEDSKSGRPEFHTIYKMYWNRCRIANAMDFDDILFYMNILLRDNPEILEKYQNFFQYILVDEYQDTNFAQHLIISQLCKAKNKLCVVGDDAQSIYSFRGANISNILNLNRQFPDLKTFKLEQNYRSTQNIINAANTLIEKNKAQIPKKIFSQNPLGDKIQVIQSYSGYEESYIVANKIVELKMRGLFSYSDFAVLYRTNAQSRVLEEALRKKNIPYKIYGGLSFYQRKEVKDSVSYFRMAVNPDDDEAFRRIINYPARGIGETTLKKIQTYASANHLSLWNTVSTEHIDNIGLNKTTINKINSFVSLISSFVEMNQNGDNAETMIKTIISEAKLVAVLDNDNTPENISKQDNIKELINGAVEFVASRQEEGNDNVGLTHFLSEISLATDQDGENDSDDGARVTLMTVHAAKGLEYENIIIIGVEEDLFPSRMNADSISAIEEERRLMYVAITRAKTNCIITYANSRFLNGLTKTCVKSRFISDISQKYLSLNQSSGKINDSSYSSKYDDYNYVERPRKIETRSEYKDYTPVNHNITLNKSSNDIESMQIHCIAELQEGIEIIHSRFGSGKIIKLDNSTDAKIIVNFESTGEKTLLLKFAKFKIK